MLDNPLFNPGGYFTNLKAFEAVESTWITLGEIVNLTQDGEYQSNIIQRYDVLIHNMNGYVAKGCIPITSNFSGNGVGEYATYKVGDAVIVTCLYNKFENAIILGSISLPGNMDVFMGKDTERVGLRKLQQDNSYAPQPLITPDRAQNPSANKIVISATQMDKDQYKNTDLLNSSQDRVKLVQEQSLPNGIEIDSGLGDKGTYFRGVEFKYINGSYYHIVVADKEDECAKASKISRIALDTVNKLKELGTQPRNSNSLIASQYRHEQHQKMYEIALESAKKCNTKSLATKQTTDAVKASTAIVAGAKIGSDYKPEENKLAVNTSKERLKLSNEEVVNFINYSMWKNELTAQQTPEAIQSMYGFYSLPGQRDITQALIDKILADPKYKTFKEQK